MRHRALMLAVAPMVALVWLQGFVLQPTLAQGGAPFCMDGATPKFEHGIAALQSRLGETMGAPAECEHVDPISGDTLQRTTTGLAYYRPSIVTSIYTDGASHWAIVDGSVVMWRNGSVTPPMPNDAERAYIQKTDSLKSRAAALQRRLTTVRQQAERGQLDAIEPASLRTLVNEFKATRDAYAAERPPARLGRYHGMMVVSLNSGMGAAELLAQARQVASPSVREGLLTSAAKHRAESERLQIAATDAYSRALPVVVN